MRFVAIFLLSAATAFASAALDQGDRDRLSIPFSVRVSLVSKKEPYVRYLATPTFQPTPEYPHVLRRATIHGTALVRLAIDGAGVVTSCTVARASQKEFSESALATAKLWTFVAAEARDGKRVASIIEYEVQFTIHEE